MMRAELIDSMGSDLTVVNAARVSMDKESEWYVDLCDCDIDAKDNCEDCTCGEAWYLKEEDKRLIKYLTKHNHFTPFTHCTITLRETVPIFVARQRFKHVVGFTYNEVSRRYVDDTPDFHIPVVWRKRAENVKQGSSDEEVITFPDHGFYAAYGDKIADAYRDHLVSSGALYNDMIHAGVAPEQARMVLPQSMMTSYYVTGSLYAFARAYLLREDSHSQKEIRDLAVEWDKIIRPLFPVSWAALVGGEK